MTISTSLPRTTLKASSVTTAFPPVISLARCKALSATTVMRIARPARRWISSAFRLSTSQVPPPTVPIPRRPTLMGFMPVQPEKEVLLHVGPFVREDAVHHGVADGAVAPHPVVADHAVLLCAKRLDGALRGEIEIVGAQPHDCAADFFKSIRKKQELTSRVDVAALETPGVPRVADLDAVRRGDDVVIAGAAYDFPGGGLPDHPGEHMAVLLSLQRGVDVFRSLARRGHRGEPELPELAVRGGFGESLIMLAGKWLQAHPMGFE